jgi:hypothetical protein
MAASMPPKRLRKASRREPRGQGKSLRLWKLGIATKQAKSTLRSQARGSSMRRKRTAKPTRRKKAGKNLFGKRAEARRKPSLGFSGLVERKMA